MKSKGLFGIAALVTTIAITSCSQSGDLSVPRVEPQFGTAADDVGVDVTVASTGSVFSLVHQSSVTDNFDSTEYAYKVQLRRYDSSGKLAWNRQVNAVTCNDQDERCLGLYAHAVEVDANGFAYVLGSYVGNYDDTTPYKTYSVYKVNANGTVVKRTNVGATEDASVDDFLSITVDKKGNVYVAKRHLDYDFNENSGTYKNLVAKYSTSGTLLWERSSAVGVPKDITVSSSGSVYVVGTKGVARYSNSGNLTWTKSGNFEQVMISGSNLFTRYRKDIRKWDGNGKQLWRRMQGGLNTLILQDMHGDGNGNVYLSGKYQVSGPNWNAVVRKLNSGGASLWTKTYGTLAYDDAKGIATLTGSEIYATGVTRGSLAHANKGGEDGYLRKLSSMGSPLWTR